MRIIFRENEISNIKIIDVGPRTLSEQYKTERDKYWEQSVKEAKEKGKIFWDGLLYSFEGLKQSNMDDPILFLGEMRYRDRLFKRSISTDDIIGKYGQDHLFTHCGVGVHILTKDKKFIVGEKRMSLYMKRNVVGHISGNLNKDELVVRSIDDLYTYAKLELEEETSIEAKDSLFRFVSISIFNNYMNFDFLYKADFRSDQVNMIFKDTEFNSFEALSLNEVRNDKRGCINDYKYAREFYNDLLLVK